MVRALLQSWRRLGTCACLLLLAGAMVWLWRSQLEGETTYFGNHDRLLYYLSNELGNLDSWKQHHHLADWDDRIFGGIDRASLGSVGTNLSPAKLLMPWVSRSRFFELAGYFPALLMGLSAFTAFFLLRRLAHPALAAVGAILYACTVFSTLAFSQLDMSALVTVFLPLGALLIYYSPVHAGSLLLLTGCTLPLVYLGFAPRSAYTVGFWLLLAAGRSLNERSWRPLVFLALALVVAVCLCLPRILLVLDGLAFYQRTLDGSAHISFGQLQDFFNVTARELLRWLDEGLLGRSPSETTQFTNNLNLSEGFQLYASTFATLLAAKTLLRHRGRWLGAFHWRQGFLCLCAWTLLLVVLVTFFRPATHLVYLLFFQAPILHARISMIGVLPAAALAVAGLQEWLEQKTPARAWLPVACGVAAGILGWWGMIRIAPEDGPAVRIEGSWGVGHSLRAAWALRQPGNRPVALETRQAPENSIWLGWESSAGPTAVFEVQAGKGAGDFTPVGNLVAHAIEINPPFSEGEARFRVRALENGQASPWIDFPPLRRGDEAPQDSDAVLGLNASHLLRLSLCAGLFAALWGAFALFPRVPPLALGSGAALATLIFLQALHDADFRLNGPQTHSFPVPFAADNMFNAPHRALRPPEAEEIQRLHAQLHPEQWRTAFLTPRAQFSGFATPHVAQFWRLRTIEGYLSGVPRRLAALDWPPGTLGFRTLDFRQPEDIPWPLLAKLNVRYLARMDTALYFNVGVPASLAVQENPSPVTPRVFFARHTTPVRPFAANPERPIRLPDDPSADSFVEGLDAPRDWTAGGEITSRFDEDVVELDVRPDPAPRFLVLNEMYHPGWTAEIDGHPARVWAVNTVMRGLEIPAGASHARMRFRSPVPPGGYWTFPLTGLAILGIALAQLRRKPAASRP